jgi:hypothetical protein
MAFCSQNPNDTIPDTNYTCAQALSNSFTLQSNQSYLRPNNGGALLPWIYTVVIIVVHLPVVYIRVVRWEAVRSWCIAFAVFTIIVVTQSYVSTQFDPGEILIWTPIILIIDAGSMIQVFFLVIEAKKRRVGDRIVLVDPPKHGQKDMEPNAEGTQQFSSLLTRFRRKRHGRQDQIALQDQGYRSHIRANQTSTSPQHPPNTGGIEPAQSSQQFHTATAEPPPNDGHAIESGQLTDGSTNSTNSDDDTDWDEVLRWYKDPAVWSAALAALSFIAVFSLQLLGLVKASQAIRTDPPLVQWCSPLFQPFGISALDGDGHTYTIAQSSNKGIGCIHIPGVWQRHWLKGTVAVLILELVFELLDIGVLMFVNSSVKWRGVKMRRPWFSIFLGMTVLLVTLICGIFFASELPPEITKSVKVIMESKGHVSSYDIVLINAGLRGTILGWSDGLFAGWRTTYFGG